MVYEKTTWLTGDRVTAGKLNKIEDAIGELAVNGGGAAPDLSGIVVEDTREPYWTFSIAAGEWSCIGTVDAPLVAGDKYIVTCNGTEYELIAWDDSGNLKLGETRGGNYIYDNYPFFIEIYENEITAHCDGSTGIAYEGTVEHVVAGSTAGIPHVFEKGRVLVSDGNGGWQAVSMVDPEDKRVLFEQEGVTSGDSVHFTNIPDFMKTGNWEDITDVPVTVTYDGNLYDLYTADNAYGDFIIAGEDFNGNAFSFDCYPLSDEPNTSFTASDSSPHDIVVRLNKNAVLKNSNLSPFLSNDYDRHLNVQNLNVKSDGYISIGNTQLYESQLQALLNLLN